jgi:Acetyltransferase (GNAT) domain
MVNCTLPADIPQPFTGFCCYPLDPIQDPRWDSLVQSHSKASVFHTVAWLRALRSTYGYKPVVFTTSPPTRELRNGIVFCDIHSWLTGRRIVSLPFSDYCEPLCDSTAELIFLIRYLQSAFEDENWKYFQVRPVCTDMGPIEEATGCLPTAEYFLHMLDLRPNLDELFLGFDKDSVQRRIQRADRAGLFEKRGRSEELLRDFYALFLITRRRQRVPPTPFRWFHNLVNEMGEALEIRVAYKEDTPIASIITLQFRDVVYYKYGCSDEQFNRYGATPWLFWNAIRSAKSKGAREFDMGRTQPDNPGLLAFKNQWVPDPTRLVYWQYPSTPNQFPGSKWGAEFVAWCFSRMPQIVQESIGKLLYRHVG